MSALNTSWPKIEFSEHRLDNGLRVVLSPDPLVPIVAVNLWYNVGSRNEIPGKTGLAHLFEHLMFEGSAHIAKGEYSRLISSIGGASNGSTTFHRTNYFEWAPSNQLELLLWMEADRMGGLLEALNQETLDKERDVVKNERRWTIDNRPYGTWLVKMQSLLTPAGHPYHHEVLGSMEDLSAASLEDVKAFFRIYYAPNNAVLTIVGDFDPEKALSWAEKYFGPIPSSREIPPRARADLPLSLGGEVREVVPDRVPLARIYLGYRSHPEGTKEHDAATMAGVVLSVGKGSRLYRRLVREKQLAQDIQFFTLGHEGVSLTMGWATARPGVSPEHLENELLQTVEGLSSEPPLEDEMVRARAQVERILIDHLMTVAARADWLSEHATIFGDAGRANERLPELMSVTSDEISKVASEVFVPDNRVVATYIPASDTVG